MDPNEGYHMYSGGAHGEVNSRVEWCKSVAEIRKDLAQAIIEGTNHREETALGMQLWNMLKTDDPYSASIHLTLLGSEIARLAREKERKRTLTLVKM